MIKPKPVPFLEAKNIFLRPVEEADIILLAEWMNDPEVTYFMFTGQTPQNREQIAATIHAIVQSEKNTVFMVCSKKGDPIGFAGLYDIHSRVCRAEFRVLIGDKSSWSKGVGTEVTKLLTFYGFDRLNLHRIWLGFTSDNPRARGAYLKAGYTEEGILRDDNYRNSRYYDTVRLAILREEYYKKYYKKDAAEFAKYPQLKSVIEAQKPRS